MKTNRTVALILTGVATAAFTAKSVSAQSEVQIQPAAKKAVQWTIETSSDIANTRKMIVDGEEREGRGRGGGGRTQTSQKVVFVQSPAGDWRQYLTAQGEVKRGGGDDQTTKIVSALHGKKITMEEKDGKLVFSAKATAEGTAEGTAAGAVKAASTLPRNAANGLSRVIDLSVLGSEKAVEVGGTYDIGNGLAKALGQLLHPVRAPQAPRAQRGGGQRQGGGQQGGRRRGQGGGQRGQRGQRTPSTFNATAMRIFGSEKLTTKATGTLVSIDEKDGAKLLTVKIRGSITGKGNPAELGLTRARNNRRGGGQGRQRGGNAGAGEGAVAIDVAGTLVVDQATQQVHSLKLDCKIDTSTTNKRTRNDRETETQQSQKGTLAVHVRCETK